MKLSDFMTISPLLLFRCTVLFRFEIDTFSKLRPDTEIPGLYLSGQDVLTCGFGGAMFGGVISAGVMLNRNIMQDMIELRKAVPPSQSSFPRPSHKDAAAKKDE